MSSARVRSSVKGHFGLKCISQDTNITFLLAISTGQRIIKKNIRFLADFKGTREERIKYLMRLSNLGSCFGATKEKTLFAFQKALYREAKTLAVTAQDKDSAHWIMRRAVLAWKPSKVLLTDQEIESLIQSDKFLGEQLK
jgi:hypothetical protein